MYDLAGEGAQSMLVNNKYAYPMVSVR